MPVYLFKISLSCTNYAMYTVTQVACHGHCTTVELPDSFLVALAQLGYIYEVISACT